MKKEAVVSLIKQNNGKWTPSDEITFIMSGEDDVQAKFKDGFDIMCFGEIENHAYISNSRGAVEDIKHLLKYCSYLGLDISEVSNIKTVTKVENKIDEVSSAKLSVYEKIFDKASKITIDQK